MTTHAQDHIITRQRTQGHRHLLPGRAASATPSICPGQIPLDPATGQLVSGDIEAEIRRVFDNLKAIAQAAGGSLAQRGQAQRLPHRPGALREGQRDHGDIFQGALSGARRGRRGRAAARRAGRNGVHTQPRLKPRVAAAGARSSAGTALRGGRCAARRASARLGVAQPQDCCSCCRCATRTARASLPIGALQPGMRAVVEGEVLLAEVAFRRRRQLLVRLADGSGSLTLRFFLFQQRAARRPGTRHAAALLHGEVRRGPLGPGDRASGIPPHRGVRRAPAADPDADLPGHRGADPGTPACAGRTARCATLDEQRRRRAAARKPAAARLACRRCALRSSSCTVRRSAPSRRNSPAAATRRSAGSRSRNCSPISCR